MMKTNKVPGGLGYTPTKPKVTGAVLEAALLQATRHQFRLDDDDFYSDPTPDGKGRVRRVPERLQQEAQGDLRARYTDEVQQAAHTLFRGRIGFKQLLHAAFKAKGGPYEPDLKGAHGVRDMLSAWDYTEPKSIEAEGASTLSISNVLANVMNKFSLQGYLFEEQSWREIAGIQPTKDFKPGRSIGLFGDVMFKLLGSSGELASASLADVGLTAQAGEYGRILTIPWVDIINDDMRMLTRAPMLIGQGAGLAINDYLWALWASLATGSVVGPVPAGTNLNGDDGNPFWRTTSSSTKGKAYKANKLTGGSSALSSSSLGTARGMLDDQTDPYGNRLGYKGATPRLLYPPSLWGTAMTLLSPGSQVAAGATLVLGPDKNARYGLLRPVMSRYLEDPNYGNSATGWYLAMDSAALPVVEVLFLDGVDTPTMLQARPDYQFDRLGIAIRGTMPFGVGAQNFRAGVYSVGA